jgi:hypothetical protein
MEVMSDLSGCDLTIFPSSHSPFGQFASMLHPALPTLGFIAAILALIPLPRQIQARYIPTIALTWWLFGACIIQSVNEIVWAGNVNNPIPVWCDISEFTLKYIILLLYPDFP